MTIERKSRGSEIQRHQQRIFLCWNSENKAARDVIIGDLLSQDAGADCVVSWLEAPDDLADETMLEQELRETELLVLIVSQAFLEQANTRRPPEYRIAKEVKLPILPVALDPELFPRFTEQEGAVHGLSLLDGEYRTKLRDQLENLLTSEALIQEIHAKAFTGRLFLSYRKKDLALARGFMEAFHDNENFRSIAIWYDNFLRAGRVFDVEIETSIDNADVFALMATPNITERGNYVMTREYPYAVKRGKHIVAVEFEGLDKKEFEESYKRVDVCVSLDGLSAAFREALPAGAAVEDISPERGFLLGVAFLKGVMVEKDVDRALKLLADSANGGNLWSAVMLGQVNNDLLHFENAVKWYKRAAEISRVLNGETNAETAKIYQAIASVFAEHGEHKFALEWSLKAWPIWEKVSGTNDLNAAKTLMDICESYQNIGETEKVPPLLERAADIYNRAADAAKTDVITGYSNLAAAYHNNMNFARAMEMHLKAISMAEKTLGGENPLTARVYTRAALTYLRIGVRETALELLNKALVVNCRILPPEHPEIAAVYLLLGSVYERFQNYPLMLDALNKAKEIQEIVFGKGHWITALTYRDIGLLYARTGSYGAARDMLSPAFGALRKSLGMNHPFTLGVYKSLRDVLDRLGLSDGDNLYE